VTRLIEQRLVGDLTFKSVADSSREVLQALSTHIDSLSVKGKCLSFKTHKWPNVTSAEERSDNNLPNVVHRDSQESISVLSLSSCAKKVAFHFYEDSGTVFAFDPNFTIDVGKKWVI